MPRRIRLGAIAKDEGPYLVDWVFHHLYFGVDEIEVWLNGTSDTSAAILDAIAAVEPRVSHRVADRLLQESLAQRRNFQHRAYTRMARRAARDGVTDIVFLDLDEYWLPRDLRTPLDDFLPDEEEVNVVSFPWGVDVPDPGARPFTAPLDARPGLQLDPHVKSVVRLDDRVRQFRTHTARTHAGRRHFVREELPVTDERAQQWGSLVPRDWLARRWDRLPEAFVLHAVHRSPVEYVASLAKGLRQTGTEVPVKVNRPGFVAGGAPALAFPHEPEALAEYAAAREEFLARAGVGPLVAQAQEAARQRGERLVAAAAQDPSLMQQLRAPLRGLPVPRLDARYPGWDQRLPACLDTVEATEDGLSVTGWAFDPQGRPLELALRDRDGTRPVTAVALERPDVVVAHPGAPPTCGFRAQLTLRGRRDDAVLLLRPSGAGLWDEWPLAR